MFDIARLPGVDLVSGLAAYYRGREAHERKLAAAAFREWQTYFGLAEKYRLLAEKAALAQT